MTQDKQEGSTPHCQRCDELAAQVEVIRAALINANEQLEGWRKSFPNHGDSEEAACRIDEAVARPTTAAAILRQRDARVLREAALQLDSGDDVTIRILNRMADDLENGK